LVQYNLIRHPAEVAENQAWALLQTSKTIHGGGWTVIFRPTVPAAGKIDSASAGVKLPSAQLTCKPGNSRLGGETVSPAANY